MINVFTNSNSYKTMYEETDKKLQIGMPRALSYYNNYPFYYGFFTALGYEIVLSDKTTTKIINEGTKYVVSDTCLPIKVYVGHIINLLEKGCDTIFVPAIMSTGYKINNCSKIRGLPEIIRNVVNKPFKMIEPVMDKTEKIGFKDFWYDAAEQLGVKDKEQIDFAIKQGWKVYNDFIEMSLSGLSYDEALKNAMQRKMITKTDDISYQLSVVIMGHGYNLFDERVSLSIIKKLTKMGVKVYTSLDVPREDTLKSIKELGEFQYWANELDLTGAAAYYLMNGKVDGIVALSAFGCGPDSLMVEEIAYHAKEREMPILHLNIDEHTGEAGFVTRLDAFVDMMLRKKRKKLSKMLCLHGSNSVTKNNVVKINKNTTVLHSIK